MQCISSMQKGFANTALCNSHREEWTLLTKETRPRVLWFTCADVSTPRVDESQWNWADFLGAALTCAHLRRVAALCGVLASMRFLH